MLIYVNKSWQLSLVRWVSERQVKPYSGIFLQCSIPKSYSLAGLKGPERCDRHRCFYMMLSGSDLEHIPDSYVIMITDLGKCQLASWEIRERSAICSTDSAGLLNLICDFFRIKSCPFTKRSQNRIHQSSSVSSV